MSKTVALIDLDTPVFKAAAATQKRSILVTHNPTQKQKEFNTRTEFKDVLKAKDKFDKLDEYSIEDIQTPEEISFSYNCLNLHINGIIESIEPDEVIYLISGSTNFRNNLEFPSRYKSNREHLLKPVNLRQIQQYAIRKYKPVVVQGAEPDDAQIYMGYDFLSRGYKPIVVSIDKDSKAYSGLYLYNPDHPHKGVQLIPEFGEIWIDEQDEVRAIGFLQYAFQHLIGDPIDGMKTTELAGIRFGAKSAYKLLKDCKTEKEALEVIVQQYRKWYNKPFEYTAWNGEVIRSDWKHMLCLYFKGIRMKSAPNDPLDAVDFFKKYNVKI